MMKRFFGLLAVLLLIHSCDDGNLQVESFDFSDVQSNECTQTTNNTQRFFVYKIKGNEALIIQIPLDNFIPEETPEDTPRVIPITGEVKVIYRLYDGEISASTICSGLPVSSPSVTEEWNANGGKIEIVTNAVHPVNETTGANIITGYSHTITFRDITFDTGDGNTQTNSDISFGTYITNIVTPVAFSTLEMRDCQPDNNLLFKYSSNQAMVLDLDDETFDYLFQSAQTPLNEPRVRYINSTNKLTYSVFVGGTSNIVNKEKICSNTGLPVLSQLWTAQNGAENTSGIIEVTTASVVGGGYEHTIRFKKINFGNAANDLTFTFGTDYLFGIYVTN